MMPLAFFEPIDPDEGHDSGQEASADHGGNELSREAEGHEAGGPTHDHEGQVANREKAAVAFAVSHFAEAQSQENVGEAKTDAA